MYLAASESFRGDASYKTWEASFRLLRTLGCQNQTGDKGVQN